MFNPKNKIIAPVIIVIAVLVLGYYFYADYKKTGEMTITDNQSSQENNATSSLESAPEVNANKKVISAPAPSLDRPIVYPADMPTQIKEDNQSKISAIIKNLKLNQDSFNDWIDLGLYRKLLGDYEGARQAWEYASLLRPQSPASFSNLGILYGYYLKDAPKAEKSFLKAIENDPKDINLYFQTYDFYKDVTKDLAKAKAIIETGLKNNPADKDLENMLKELNQ